MATIKQHAQHLAKHDPTRFAEFEAELAYNGLYKYYDRSILKHDGYNISKMQAGLATILKKYLPFEDWHFTTNTLPELCHADEGSITNQIPS